MSHLRLVHSAEPQRPPQRDSIESLVANSFADLTAMANADRAAVGLPPMKSKGIEERRREREVSQLSPMRAYMRDLKRLRKRQDAERHPHFEGRVRSLAFALSVEDIRRRERGEEPLTPGVEFDAYLEIARARLLKQAEDEA